MVFFRLLKVALLVIAAVPALLFAALLFATLSLAAGQDPGRQIEGSQLRALIVGKTWYGTAISAGYDWVEFYEADGTAYYLDDAGFLVGTWDVRSEKEVCFDYPALGGFCFAVYETPSGQVAIYDLDERTLIHMTTSIVDGDPEGLALRPPQVGDEVGD
jgi:hypothetical protein